MENTPIQFLDTEQENALIIVGLFRIWQLQGEKSAI